LLRLRLLLLRLLLRLHLLHLLLRERRPPASGLGWS